MRNIATLQGATIVREITW